jgi:hypothetical protein
MSVNGMVRPCGAKKNGGVIGMLRRQELKLKGVRDGENFRRLAK